MLPRWLGFATISQPLFNCVHWSFLPLCALLISLTTVYTNCVHQLCIPTVCTNFVHWLPLRLCASAATNNRNLLRVRFKRYRTGTEKYTVQYGPPRNNATNYLCFAAVRSALIFRSGSRAVLMATTKNYNYNWVFLNTEKTRKYYHFYFYFQFINSHKRVARARTRWRWVVNWYECEHHEDIHTNNRTSSALLPPSVPTTSRSNTQYFMK